MKKNRERIFKTVCIVFVFLFSLGAALGLILWSKLVAIAGTEEPIPVFPGLLKLVLKNPKSILPALVLSLLAAAFAGLRLRKRATIGELIFVWVVLGIVFTVAMLLKGTL